MQKVIVKNICTPKVQAYYEIIKTKYVQRMPDIDTIQFLLRQGRKRHRKSSGLKYKYMITHVAQSK